MNFRPLFFRLCLVCSLGISQSAPAQESRSESGADGRPGGNRHPAERNSTPRTSADRPPSPPEADTPPEPELAIVAKFDVNSDQRLDAKERQTARAYLATLPRIAPPTRPGGAADRPQPIALEPAKPGAKLSPAAVDAYPDRPLYDPAVVRTVFLEFEDKNWEQELADFAGTDVQVPARVTVDGRVYAGVGVRFAPRRRLDPAEPGYKRTLLLSFDFTDPAQRIAGQRRLQLLDSHTDPTGLRTALYLDAARSQIFAPWASFARVAINGENWGVYTNAQPFDERFAEQSFGTAAGARWVMSAAAALAYLGDDPAPYRALYQLQTPEDPTAWAALVRLCRTLAQTPPDQLEAALAPQLELTETMRLLALENALINQDGYRARASGYGLYLAPGGRFHLVPLAAESSLRLVEIPQFSARGPDRGGRGGPESSAGASHEMPDAVQRTLAQREAAPRQAQSNLAMLLSSSFINKSDRNDDRKVTLEEWLGFAQGWFNVLDENYTGSISRDQFIAGFRLFLTPPSVIDGRTRQTFGKDDPAARIGGGLFADLKAGPDGLLTRAEFLDGFARWHGAWSDARTKLMTEPDVNRGLNALLGGMIFSADQSFIAVSKARGTSEDMPDGRGRDGPRGGSGGGGPGGGASAGGVNANASVNLGLPGLNLGLGGPRGGRGGGGSRGVMVLREELDVLAGLDDTRRPLLARLLAVPALRGRYLACIHELAEDWMTWDRLGARAQAYHKLIAPYVEEETRRPAGYTRFVQDLDQQGADEESGNEPSLKQFLAARRAYLLEDETVLRHASGR